MSRKCIISRVLFMAVMIMILFKLSVIDAKAFCYRVDRIEDGQECFFHGSSLYRTGTQGMCVADHYLIYTRWESNQAPTTYVVIDLETGKEINHYDFMTSHSNSLTYNEDTNQVVASYGGMVYFLDFQDGKLTYHDSVAISHNCPKIAYDTDRKVYYLGTTTAVYETSDFKSLKKLFACQAHGINQGMGFDGEYLYIPWLISGEDKISVYDLDGREQRILTVSDTYKEIEEVDFYDGKMLLNVTSSGTTDGIYQVKESHDYGKSRILKEPTCAEKGLKEESCLSCGRKEKSKIKATEEHVPGKWETEIEAACEKDGLSIRRCNVCKKVLDKKIIPAFIHQYSSWIMTKEATVLSPGEESRICSLCGLIQMKETEKLQASMDIEVKEEKIHIKLNKGDFIKSIEETGKKGDTYCKITKDSVTMTRYGKVKLLITSEGGANQKIYFQVSRFPSLCKKWNHLFSDKEKAVCVFGMNQKLKIETE